MAIKKISNKPVKKVDDEETKAKAKAAEAEEEESTEEEDTDSEEEDTTNEDTDEEEVQEDSDEEDDSDEETPAPKATKKVVKTSGTKGKTPTKTAPAKKSVKTATTSAKKTDAKKSGKTAGKKANSKKSNLIPFLTDEDGDRATKNKVMALTKQQVALDNDGKEITLAEATMVVDAFEKVLDQVTDNQSYRFMGGMIQIQNRNGQVYQSPKVDYASYKAPRNVKTLTKDIGEVAKLKGTFDKKSNVFTADGKWDEETQDFVPHKETIDLNKKD